MLAVLRYVNKMKPKSAQSGVRDDVHGNLQLVGALEGAPDILGMIAKMEALVDGVLAS